MAVVPYYDQTKVKADLRITDAALDTQLDHWGEEAENEIDDLLYTKAKKARRITALPVLPYAAGSVPESVQGAADYLVKARYYTYTKNAELTKESNTIAVKKINGYIKVLAQDAEIYWRIAR